MKATRVLGAALLVFAGYMVVGELTARLAPSTTSTFPLDLVEFSAFPFHAAALTTHMRQSFSYDSGDEAVLVRWGEVDPRDPENWFVQEVVEAVAFRVTAVASAEGGRNLYVAGVRSDGVDVIERWHYPARSGGYGIQITSGPAQPIGESMPPYAAQEVLNGSAFIPPDANRNPARREVVYQGTTMGHVRSMAADPEGRFLLVLSYPSGSVHQVSLFGSAPPVLLLTSLELPHLSFAKTIDVQERVGGGRTYVLTELTGCVFPANHKRSLLSDTNNDGVIDSSVTLTSAEWVAAGLDESPAWELYQNVGVPLNW